MKNISMLLVFVSIVFFSSCKNFLTENIVNPYYEITEEIEIIDEFYTVTENGKYVLSRIFTNDIYENKIGNIHYYNAVDRNNDGKKKTSFGFYSTTTDDIYFSLDNVNRMEKDQVSTLAHEFMHRFQYKVAKIRPNYIEMDKDYSPELDKEVYGIEEEAVIVGWYALAVLDPSLDSFSRLDLVINRKQLNDHYIPAVNRHTDLRLKNI